MRILEVCFSTGVGGLELYAARISRELEKSGHQVLAVGTGDCLFAQHCCSHNRLAPHWRRARYLRRALWLFHAIQQFKPDVIHVHHRRDFPLTALVHKLIPKQRIRLVYHRHTDLPAKARTDIYHRYLYAGVDRFVAITARMRERAAATLPLHPSKITTLIHGIPPKPCALAANEAAALLRPAAQGIRIGCFSRIEAIKGQHTVVRAVALLAEQGLNVQLIFFGAICDRQYWSGLQHLISARGLDDDIYYHGFVDNAQAFMACCDIVVHAAAAEPFGLVVGEAMRSGAAVIAANTGGVPEIIDSDAVGLLFSPHNAEELAAHIEALAKDGQRRERMARNAQARAQRKFCPSRHTQRLETLLRGAAAVREA